MSSLTLAISDALVASTLCACCSMGGGCCDCSIQECMYSEGGIVHISLCAHAHILSSVGHESEVLALYLQYRSAQQSSLMC